MLIISILVPHPGIVAAQEVAEPETVEESSARKAVEEDVGAVEESSEAALTASATELASEQKPSEEEKEGEPQMESLTVSGGDPFHEDERKPINEKVLLEPEPFDGSLRYSFPLTIPPGRLGLEPDVSLTYSSQRAAGPGIVGYGWDIAIPYIERINRHGTDKLYTNDTFYSSFDGELASTTGEQGGIGDLAEAESAFFSAFAPMGKALTVFAAPIMAVPHMLAQAGTAVFDAAAAFVDRFVSIQSKLEGKSADEKATIKGKEIAEIGSVQRTKRAGVDIEIVSMQAIDGGVEVFARAWNAKGEQIGFGDGTVDTERFRIMNPPILVLDEAGDIVRTWTDERTKESGERRMREDPKEALLQTLEHSISVMKHVHRSERIVKDKVGNTTSIFYPDGDPESSSVDGYASHDDGQSWSTNRNGAGEHAGASGVTEREGIWGGGTNDHIGRFIFLFNVSSIASTSVSTATFSVYPDFVANDYADAYDYLNVVQPNPASNTALTNGDFDSFTGLTGVMHTGSNDAKDLGSLSLNAYTNWTLNATGTAWVQGQSVAKLGLAEGHDIENQAPASGLTDNDENAVRIYMADADGSTQDPKLTVEHYAGGGPEVPTNLFAEGKTNPSNVSDPTPEFSAIFNGEDAADIATHYQLQVATSSNFASTYWDSGQTALASSTPNHHRIADIAYAGSALASSTVYYWRIKFWNDTNDEGAWSTAPATFWLANNGFVYYGAKIENGDFREYKFVNGTYWEVTDKYGTVFKFGTSTLARQDNPSNSGEIFKWMLEEVRDRNGNFVTYTYYKDGGEIYPDTITYTGNGTSGGMFSVAFTREARSDIATSTASGFPVVTKYRISEIQAKINGSWVRKYDLDYTTGDNGVRSLLRSVTETGKDDQGSTIELPATQFSYSTSTPNWTYNSNWTGLDYFIAHNEDWGTRLGDFNGDGLPDIIRAFGGSDHGSAEQYIRINDGDGTGWTADASWVLPGDFVVNGHDLGLRVVDVNGDGLPDLIRSYNGGGTSEGKSAYLNTGTGFATSTVWIPPVYFSVTDEDNGARFADVNGDGLVDLLWGKNGAESYINTGVGWREDDNWNIPVPFLSGAGEDKGVRIVDVNADGLPDLLHAEIPAGGSPVSETYLNTGYGWELDTTWSPPIYFVENEEDLGVRFADANGDGFVDIIRSYTDGGTTQKVYINTSPGWVDDTDWTPPEIISSSGNDQGTRLDDVNGDGLVDFVRGHYVTGGGTDVQKVYLKNGNVPDLLTSITSAPGATTNITYQGTPEYTSGGTLLNKNLPLVLQTVKDIAVSDGFGTWATTTFSYGGGDYYYNTTHNRRFAGFATTTATNGLGYVTKTYAHQGNGTNSGEGELNDDQSKIGKPYRAEMYDASNNLYAKTVTYWANVDLGNDRDFVKRTQTIDFAVDGDGDDREKAETYVYDNATGNLTTKVEYGEVTGLNNGTFTDLSPLTGNDRFTTTYTYAASTTLHLLGLLSQETVVNSASTTVKDTKFYYDNLAQGAVSKGNMTKQELWKSGGTWIDIEKTYDGTYGLVTEDKDPRDNTTTYTYEANNLYVATTTNAKGHTTGFVYDYSIGKPKRTNDPHNLVFETVYDGLDRVTQQKQPDLTSPGTLVTVASTTYTDTIGSRRIWHVSHLSSATSTDTFTYLDGLNRPIQKRAEAEDSNYAVKDYQYNEIGTLKKESLPYFSAGSSKTTATTTNALFATTSYDPMDRPTTIATIVGTTTNAYNNWKHTVTDPNNETKDFNRDAYGNLASVAEYLNGARATTTYEYNYLKNLTKITDSLSNIRNFTYDGLGRRLTAEDLHAAGDATYGTWTYVYDDAGNVATTTDPQAQTIEYFYDVLNRVTSEDATSTGSITYTYDTCTYGKGRLCGATTTITGDDTGTNFIYDPIGNIASEHKVLQLTDYTTSYTYDRQGNETSITYPDNAVVTYNRNSAGQLESVFKREDGESTASPIIKAVDYAPTGQELYVHYGNDVETTHTYDASELHRLIGTFTTAPEGMGGMGGFGAPPGKPEVAPLAQASLIDDVLDGVTTTPVALDEEVIVATDNAATTTEEVALTDEIIPTELPATESETPATIVPKSVTDNPLATDGLIKNEKDARAWRAYHRERVAYLTMQSDLPSHVLESARYGEAKFEKYLLDKGYIESEEGEIKTPLISMIRNTAKRFAGWFLPETAYAYLFGKEDFETCAELPCSFDATASWGDVAQSLDSSGKVTGNDSLKEVVSGEGGGGLKTTDYNTSDIWVQFKVWIPSTMTWGTAGYVGLLLLQDPSNASTIWMNLENYGAGMPRLTVAGDVLGYTNTNLNLVEGAVNTIQMRVKIGASTGDVQVWLNNSTETSPNFDCTTCANTGTDNIDDVTAGYFYAPDSGIATTYFDNIIVSNAFITEDTSPSILQDTTYVYDNVGNITELYDFAYTGTRKSVLYTYDDLHRLTTASTTAASSTPYRHTFTYSIIGNMATSTPAGDYLYASTGYTNPHAPTTINGTALSYDRTGNLLSYGTTTYAYNYRNELTRASTTASLMLYDYDHTGQRVRSYHQTQNNNRHIPNRYYNVSGLAETKHIFVNGKVVATIETTGATTTPYYIHADHLGSSNVVTDGAGNLTEVSDYYPYGAPRIDDQTEDFVEQRKYIGEEYDTEVGLNYLNARYYDGGRGQFLRVDPVSRDNPQQLLADPQQQNMYGYARGNPIANLDINGELAVYFAGRGNGPESYNVLAGLVSDKSHTAGIAMPNMQQFNYQDVTLAAAAAREAYNAGESIEIIGHSLGGNAALKLANQLNRDNIPIQELHLLDPVSYNPFRLPQSIPDNVKHYSHYEPGISNHLPFSAWVIPFKTSVHSWTIPGVGHTTIDDLGNNNPVLPYIASTIVRAERGPQLKQIQNQIDQIRQQLTGIQKQINNLLK